MEKEFRKKMNPAILYFEIFYVIYVGILFFNQQLSAAIVCVIAGVLIFGYLNLLRPYKYTINRKTLTINKRLGKSKEINIVSCETICDPVPKLSKIITSPTALEIYTESNERFLVDPAERMKFIETIVAANKRIHVQVKEYAKTHRSYEKKRKRALKEEKLQEMKDAK